MFAPSFKLLCVCSFFKDKLYSFRVIAMKGYEFFYFLSSETISFYCLPNFLLGEATFDQVFNYAHHSSFIDCQDENQTECSVAKFDSISLNESKKSQHFKEIDNSDQTFDGSVHWSWLSFLSCSARFSKLRRRRNEGRPITRMIRQRVSNWFASVFH